MRTDDLIRGLAADPRPAPPVAATLGRAVPLGLLASLGLLLAFWGLRPGLGPALAAPVVAAKALIPAGVGLAGLAAGLRLARPEGRVGAAGLVLGLLALLALGVAAWGLAETPRAAWGEAARGRTLVACLMSIPALAVLPLAAILLALGRGATTRPRLAGLLAGLAGGGLAAALYALHCPEDSPLFFVPWYGTGVLAAGLAGWLLGPRALRW